MIITSYELEECARVYQESRLADAAQARLRASIPRPRATGDCLFAVTLRYSRYALISLALAALGLTDSGAGK